MGHGERAFARVGQVSVGAVEWWRRFVAMPDRERAKLLALILGGVIVGVLYALGGLSLYLRSGYLTSTPTRLQITRVGVESVEAATAALEIHSGASTVSAPSSAQGAAVTLYPTVTPDLTRTAMAFAPLFASATPQYVTATPFPTPTGSGVGQPEAPQ